MPETLLPATTGAYEVGNRRLFLSDPRGDPFSGAPDRQISVTAWYPTCSTGPAARYLSVNDAFDETMALELTNGIESRSCGKSWWGGGYSCGWWGGVDIADTMFPNIRARDTRAVLGAPVRTDLGALPVVIFSPGFGVPGNHSSILAQELASHGYLVCTLSHTYESIVTELADSVVKQNANWVGGNQWAKVLNARIDDARYVLNQLPTLPHGLGAVADTDAVAMAGHSYGGPTGMELAAQDPRITAVAVLDGTAGWPGTSNQAQDNGLTQPVMLLSGPIDPNDSFATGAEHASWDTYDTHPHGPLHILTIAGAGHYAVTDVGLLCGADKKSTLCGSIDPARAMELHPRYVRAFLDTYLRGTPDVLMDGPHVDWPEVTFPS